MCNGYKKIQWMEIELRLEIETTVERHGNYPVEQLLNEGRGKFIPAWMPHLEPGYLPRRDALVQLCVSWIVLCTDGRNKLKNGVLDLFIYWAAFPCVVELTTKVVISPLKGSSCSGFYSLLKSL